MLKSPTLDTKDSDRHNGCAHKGAPLSESLPAPSIRFSKKIPSELRKLIQRYVSQSADFRSAPSIEVVEKKSGNPELVKGAERYLLKVTPDVKLFSSFLQSEATKIHDRPRIVGVVMEELKNWGVRGFSRALPNTLKAIVSETSASLGVSREVYQERGDDTEAVRSQLAVIGGLLDSQRNPELLSLSQLANNPEIRRGVAHLAKRASSLPIAIPAHDGEGRISAERLSLWGDSIADYSTIAIAEYLINRSTSGLQGVLQICREAQSFIHQHCTQFVRDLAHKVTPEALSAHLEEVDKVYGALSKNPFKEVCKIADSALSKEHGALRALKDIYMISRDEVNVRSTLLRAVPELSAAALSEKDKNWRGMPDWFSDVEKVCDTPPGSDIRLYRKAIGALADQLLALACSPDDDQRDKFVSMFGEFAEQPQQEAGSVGGTSEEEKKRLEEESVETVTKCLWDLAVWARSDVTHFPCPNLHKVEGGILEVARRFIYLRAHDRYEDMYEVTQSDTLRSVVNDLSHMEECLRAHARLPSRDGMTGYGQMMLAVAEQQCASKINELIGGLARQHTQGDDLPISLRRLEHIARHKAVTRGGRSVAALLEVPTEVLRSRSQELVTVLESLFERCVALNNAGKHSSILNCLEPVSQLADRLQSEELRKKAARFCEKLMNELEDLASSISEEELDEPFARDIISELQRWRPGPVFSDAKERILRVSGLRAKGARRR